MPILIDGARAVVHASYDLTVDWSKALNDHPRDGPRLLARAVLHGQN
jgi:hypothetical protein